MSLQRALDALSPAPRRKTDTEGSSHIYASPPGERDGEETT